MRGFAAWRTPQKPLTLPLSRWERERSNCLLYKWLQLNLALMPSWGGMHTPRSDGVCIAVHAGRIRSAVGGSVLGCVFSGCKPRGERGLLVLQRRPEDTRQLRAYPIRLVKWLRYRLSVPY